MTTNHPQAVLPREGHDKCSLQGGRLASCPGSTARASSASSCPQQGGHRGLCEPRQRMILAVAAQRGCRQGGAGSVRMAAVGNPPGMFHWLQTATNLRLLARHSSTIALKLERSEDKGIIIEMKYISLYTALSDTNSNGDLLKSFCGPKPFSLQRKKVLEILKDSLLVFSLSCFPSVGVSDTLCFC